MVAIRLRRAGSKKRPYFRIVVTDSRAARDSSFVEILGHYNPRTRPALVDIQQERVDYWIASTAGPYGLVKMEIASCAPFSEPSTTKRRKRLNRSERANAGLARILSSCVRIASPETACTTRS